VFVLVYNGHSRLVVYSAAAPSGGAVREFVHCARRRQIWIMFMFTAAAGRRWITKRRMRCCFAHHHQVSAAGTVISDYDYQGGGKEHEMGFGYDDART
jgi:hypothetical protein